MKYIIFYVVFFIFINSVEANENYIKHHYVDSIANKYMLRTLKADEIKHLSCSPDEENRIWICYLDSIKKPCLNNKYEENWTLVIDFINNEFSLYSGYIKKFNLDNE